MTELIQLERAIRGYLVAEGVSTVPPGQVYAGSDFPDGGSGLRARKVQLPCVIVTASNADPIAPFVRSYRADVDVIVRTQRDDEADDAHIARCNQVFAALYEDDIREEISDQETGFTLFELIKRALSSEPQKRYWESKLSFTAFLAPADL